MTSRRQFFGLLAAAPIAAPAIAKELVSTWPPSGYSRFGPFQFVLSDPKFDYIIDSNMMRFRDWTSTRCAYFDFHPFESDDGDYSTAHIPNRLYGTTINENGEAV